MPETKADVGNLPYCGMSSISESVSMRECGRALSKVGECGLAWGELAVHAPTLPYTLTRSFSCSHKLGGLT